MTIGHTLLFTTAMFDKSTALYATSAKQVQCHQPVVIDAEIETYFAAHASLLQNR